MATVPEFRADRETALSPVALSILDGREGIDALAVRVQVWGSMDEWKLGKWGAGCWRRFPALVARRGVLLVVRACRAPAGVHIYEFLMR